MDKKLKEIKEEYISYSDISTNKNNKVLTDIHWLIDQVEKVNKIKDFCEYEANIYDDLIKQNQHKINRILFEGKQQAFNNVINHIKDLEGI